MTPYITIDTPDQTPYTVRLNTSSVSLCPFIIPVKFYLKTAVLVNHSVENDDASSNQEEEKQKD